jgi:hypothetical protein
MTTTQEGLSCMALIIFSGKSVHIPSPIDQMLPTVFLTILNKSLFFVKKSVNETLVATAKRTDF